MGKGAGIKLDTGETIGAWSLADHDGQRDNFDRVSSLKDQLHPVAATDATGEENDADDFEEQMLENIAYRRLQLQAKQ